MNKVVSTSREVRFTVTVALKIFIQKQVRLTNTQLKEEVLEEVGGVDDDENQDGGQVDCQDGIQDPPLQYQGHLDASINVAGVVIRQSPVGYEVLGEDSFRFHVEEMGSDCHH